MAIDPTATPNTTAEMLRLLGGDLSGSLSSGDKLLALSGLLRSATRSGRRAGLTPQQVIGDIQKSKLAELQGRMQVETLRRDEEQRRQRAAVFQQYAADMDPRQQAMFTYGLTDEQKGEVAKQAFIGAELARAGLRPGTPEFAEGARRLTATGRVITNRDGSQDWMPGTDLSDLVPGAQPAAAQPATASQVLPRSQRPDMTDQELIRQARLAVEGGADQELVFRQLQEWGVRP